MATTKIPTREEIIKKLNQQLKKNKDVQAWFNKYNKHHWEHFISEYAGKKVEALRNASHYEEEVQPQSKVYNGIARDCLELIQQAKLFRLQCEWRSGDIILPTVQVLYDFELWERNVFYCPFLHPVTMEEVELYIEFLNSPEAEDYFMGNYNMDSWQNYENFKEQWDEQYEDYIKLPDWYKFYDERCFGGGMFELENWRGEMENYYRQASVGNILPRPTKTGSPAPAPMIDIPTETELSTAATATKAPSDALDEYQKPSQLGPHVRMEFARMFEKPDDADKILNLHRAELHEEGFEEYDMYYEYLKTITEPIKFEAGIDWKASLKNTVMKYRFKKVAEALPRVWRQYNREIGDPEAYMHRLMAKSAAFIREIDQYDVRGIYIRDIIKGRQKLGEPADLNY